MTNVRGLRTGPGSGELVCQNKHGTTEQHHSRTIQIHQLVVPLVFETQLEAAEEASSVMEEANLLVMEGVHSH